MKCAVCEQTIEKGKTDYFLIVAGERREVCELCYMKIRMRMIGKKIK